MGLGVSACLVSCAQLWGPLDNPLDPASTSYGGWKPTLVTVEGNSTTVPTFQMATTEVTQAQYLSVMGVNPSSNTSDLSRPVERVTWYDAVEFCNRLSAKEGLAPAYTITGRKPASGYPITAASVTMDNSQPGYRLPTSEEWTWAASGGILSHGFEYAGSNALDEVAWYLDNSGQSPHRVATKAPNELGLYDLSGNVLEWCWDWMDDVSQTQKTARGGTWDSDEGSCGIGIYWGLAPSHNFYAGGIRVVRGGTSPLGSPSLVALAGDSQVSLSWNTVAGATGYNVYYASGGLASPASTKFNSTVLTTTSTLVTGLSNDTLYSFVVTALNSGGEGSPSVAVTATPMVPSPPDLQKGLVAYYPFSGNAKDQSGEQNDGVVSGASLTADRHGAENSAYGFDGVSDFIQIADSSSLRISANISISCWIRYDSNPSTYEDIVMKGNTAYGFQFSPSGGSVLFHLTSGGWRNLDSFFSPAKGVWCHLVGTYDGQMQKVYVNGVLTNSSLWTGTIETNNAPLFVGYQVAADNAFYKGFVDEIRVYNRALTPTEVQILSTQ